MSIYEKNYEALKIIADKIDEYTQRNVTIDFLEIKRLQIELIKAGCFNQIGQNLGLIWEALHSISNQMPTNTRGRD